MEDASPTRSFCAVAPYYDRLMAGVPYHSWVRYLHELWEQFELRPKSVLDIACGTGTVALLLAQEGYRVCGVDSSPAMLREAGKKAQEAGQTVPFVNQDAAELDLGEAFDTVISLFDSLNNIIDPQCMQLALERAYQHTAQGGLFIFDLNTEYAFLEGLFNQRSSVLETQIQYLWLARYDPEQRLCTITMDFAVRPHTDSSLHQFREVHVQRAYSKPEVLQMLQTAGFCDMAVFDAYTLRPPRRRSDRVFFVARRPYSG